MLGEHMKDKNATMIRTITKRCTKFSNNNHNGSRVALMGSPTFYLCCVRYSVGDSPTTRLKYLPKNEAEGKLSS